MGMEMPPKGKQVVQSEIVIVNVLEPQQMRIYSFKRHHFFGGWDGGAKPLR
jgi:hypothetical protein